MKIFLTYLWMLSGIVTITCGIIQNDGHTITHGGIAFALGAILNEILQAKKEAGK